MKTHQMIAICSSLCMFFSSLFYAQAQDKTALKIKNTSFEYKIDKNTKDGDLEQIKNEINDEKIAKLEFSNLQRNEQGELISITTKFEDKNGSFQQSSQYSSMGITPFSVIIHEKENGHKYLELANSEKDRPHSMGDVSERSALLSNFGNIGSEDSQKFFDEYFSESMQRMYQMQEEMLKQQEEFMKLLAPTEKAEENKE